MPRPRHACCARACSRGRTCAARGPIQEGGRGLRRPPRRRRRRPNAQLALAEIYTEWAPLIWDADLDGAIDKLEIAVADLGAGRRRSRPPPSATSRSRCTAAAGSRCARARRPRPPRDFERAIARSRACSRAPSRSRSSSRSRSRCSTPAAPPRPRKLFKSARRARATRRSYLKGAVREGRRRSSSPPTRATARGTVPRASRPRAELAKLETSGLGDKARRAARVVLGDDRVRPVAHRPDRPRRASRSRPPRSTRPREHQAPRRRWTAPRSSLGKDKLGALEGLGGNPPEALVNLGIIYDSSAAARRRTTRGRAPRHAASRPAISRVDRREEEDLWLLECAPILAAAVARRARRATAQRRQPAEDHGRHLRAVGRVRRRAGPPRLRPGPRQGDRAEHRHQDRGAVVRRRRRAQEGRRSTSRSSTARATRPTSAGSCSRPRTSAAATTRAVGALLERRRHDAGAQGQEARVRRDRLQRRRLHRQRDARVRGRPGFFGARSRQEGPHRARSPRSRRTRPRRRCSRRSARAKGLTKVFDTGAGAEPGVRRDRRQAAGRRRRQGRRRGRSATAAAARSPAGPSRSRDTYTVARRPARQASTRPACSRAPSRSASTARTCWSTRRRSRTRPRSRSAPTSCGPARAWISDR